MSMMTRKSAQFFQLSALSLALGLAGCGSGGGDGTTVDVVSPPLNEDDEGTPTNGDGNNGGDGGEETPVQTEADFFLQKITSDPATIQLDDGPQQVTVQVKVVETATGGAVEGKDVVLSIEDSETIGVTIDGSSTQTSNARGSTTYILNINPAVVANKSDLLEDGITVMATAQALDGTTKSQKLVIGVSEEGDGESSLESDLELTTALDSATVSNDVINVKGDDVTLTVQAKEPNGAVASGVEAVLGIANIDGVSIVGGNRKTTDEDGNATFTVRIDDDLSDEAKAALIDSGIAYNLTLIEEDGAEVSQAGNWNVANPDSDFNLKLSGNDEPLSAYGDLQNILIDATPKSGQVPTDVNGATATVRLNGSPAGVRLSTDTVTLDSEGQANVNLIIDDDLTQAQKMALVKEGISYTVTLTEPNQVITTATAQSSVYIPEAEYDLTFDQSDKKILSSSGGIAEVQFRVNDSNGGPVAGQVVTASLSSKLKSSGLVTLNNAAQQTTNEKGIVTYEIRVPAGLTAAQKIELEEIGRFVLGVSLKEESGVVSTATSQPIAISSEVGDSDINLTSDVSVDEVNALGDSFTINVNATQQNGGAAVGQDVQLIISGVPGVSIVGGNRSETGEDGVASFTVNLSTSISQEERDELIADGIEYLAILTEDDGTQSSVRGNVAVAAPESLIEFAGITSSDVSEIGGNSVINVSLAQQNSGDAVVGRSVTLELTNTARNLGVTIDQATQSTDVEGRALFNLNVPNDLTQAQRNQLKQDGITYLASYSDNGITYNSDLQTVEVTPVQVKFDILNASETQNGQSGYEFDTTGGLRTVSAQLINQETNQPLANQDVLFSIADRELAQLLTVNGQIGSSVITATTDGNGIVSLDVLLPNDLSQQQRDAINNSTSAFTLTETVSNKQASSTINVSSTISDVIIKTNATESLNLNGGEIEVRVVAEDSNGNSVPNQTVALALPSRIAEQGITLASSPTQTTDNSGVATFVIAAPSNLTNDQKNNIGRSFAIGLATRDANGNSETQTQTVNTIRPTQTQESLTLGANKVVDSGGDTFKVFARITDDNGNGVANTPVQLAVTDPLKTGVSIADSTVQTGNDGIAVFDLTLEPGDNVDQQLLLQGIEVTATARSTEGVTLTQNYLVNVDSTTIDSYVILKGSDRTRLNTGGDQTNVTFRVVDNQGGALEGVPVQLSIDNPERTGAALTTTSVVTTDAQGQIEAGVVLGAGSVNARLNHDIVVTAQIVTPQYDENGNSNLEVRATEEIILQATGTSIEVETTDANLTGGETTEVTTTVTDAAGKRIANADVNLVDADGNTIDGIPEVRTDQNGVATFELNEARLPFDDSGNLRVFALVSGENDLVTQRSNNSVTLVQASLAGISFGELENVYNVNETQDLVVNIRTDSPAEAQELIGETVEVQTTLGTFANGEVITEIVITEDIVQDNRILVPVQLTSPNAGIAVLTAEVEGQSLSTTVDTRFRATTPTKMLLQTVRSVIKPGGSTDIVATVRDENDTPVEGVTVVFSRSQDTSAGRLSAATAVTNERGEAVVTYQANAGSRIDGVTINARLMDESFNVPLQTTQITVSVDAAFVTLAFSDRLESSGDNIYDFTPASIAVTDGAGRPVANREVTIRSAAVGYAQGRFCAVFDD